MKILSFGEILWDIYPENKYIGGAPFNFAAHLAKSGESSYMLTAVGNDELGVEALSKLKEFDISTKFVRILDNRQTGKCLVSLDENSVPTYNLLNDVAYDYIDTNEICGNFDLLYFGSLALRNSYNFKALSSLISQNSFKDIFVDVNIRKPYYSARTVKFCAEHATIIKISDEEMPIVAELLKLDVNADYKLFATLLAQTFKNLKYIIVTLGAKGAYAFDVENVKGYYCESIKVDVVSTVGAGDSFSAAYIHKYLNGSSIKECLDYASRIAAFVVSNYDAVPNYVPSQI